MELVIIFSSLVANFITKFAKPSKVALQSEEEMEQRKLLVRVINAVVGLALAIVTYVLIGGELDMTELQGYIQIVITGALTFAASQGWYFLSSAKQ